VFQVEEIEVGGDDGGVVVECLRHLGRRFDSRGVGVQAGELPLQFGEVGEGGGIVEAGGLPLIGQTAMRASRLSGDIPATSLSGPIKGEIRGAARY
jgi:hypothetical protein